MFKKGQKVKFNEFACEKYGVSDYDFFYIDSEYTAGAGKDGLLRYSLTNFEELVYNYELESLDMNNYEQELMEKGFLPHCSFPGSYPIYYIASNNDVMCNECAEKEPYDIVGHDCYMEGPIMYCDGCTAEIESAYGDPYEEDDE